uniref:Uncharacterized protein n=1 Tax=Oryza sativa subsp. japonica TaxID=39947 RepID=Q338T3_ORYSJ|nr:hypothetical protein LOC_Os10g24650 [Oryza sativa Japonica Group]
MTIKPFFGISGFEKNRFWENISGGPICKKPRTNDIHNPTLRLMHKWIVMTLFPRGDLRPIREDKLIIMFVTVRKIKVAPVKCAMVDHIGTHATWREMNKKVQHPCKCTKPVRNQLGMHPDGPKLYTIASEARSGRVPARADREHLMTYTGEHEHSFPQIKQGSILIKDPERKASLVGDVSPPAEILFMLYD